MPNIGNLAQRTAQVISMQSALTTAASRSLTVPASATHAVIDNSGTSRIRYTIDGTTPTASVGNLLAAGGSLTWTDPNVDFTGWLNGFKAIQEGATGTLEVVYYKFLAVP